jgi:AcrR family transcriptional regulator
MSDKDKPKPQRCTARKADGRPCQAAALRGTTRCWHHSFKVPGRPTKLTPELRDRILDAVLEGNYLETAAQVAGINKTTLYRWLRKAEDLEATALEHVTDDDLDDGADLWQHVDPADWVYLNFRHALKSAEAYAETELVRQTLTRGRGWQAAMTVLERRHPARWGRRLDAHVDHSGEVSRTVEVIAPSDDERALVVAKLAEAGALEPGDPDQED